MAVKNDTVDYNELKYLCTGCGACINICPVDAISMKEEQYGFSVPVIDKAKCINCGKCKAACPVFGVNFHKKSKKCFAVMAQNALRMQVSSGGGGAFTCAVRDCGRWICLRSCI